MRHHDGGKSQHTRQTRGFSVAELPLVASAVPGENTSRSGTGDGPHTKAGSLPLQNGQKHSCAARTAACIRPQCDRSQSQARVSWRTADDGLLISTVRSARGHWALGSIAPRRVSFSVSDKSALSRLTLNHLLMSGNVSRDYSACAVLDAANVQAVRWNLLEKLSWHLAAHVVP
jgi:hypothetical protein